jgi:Zn-dependent protease
LSHGIVAIYFGDRTPIETGHMTLNPAAHMSGMSIILLLVAGIAWGSMPINPSRLRGRHARALVALAGPLCNVLLALIALTALGLWDRRNSGEDPTAAIAMWRYFLFIFGVTNLMLAIFNLLPVPPLDGSNIVADFSSALARTMYNMRQGGQSTIVFLVIFAFAGYFIEPMALHAAEWFLILVRGF